MGLLSLAASPAPAPDSAVALAELQDSLSTRPGGDSKGFPLPWVT